MTVSYLSCVILVSSFYHLPPRVLPAIQAVEGGLNGMVHHNANGSEDFGVMQVNTVWIDPLAHLTHLPASVVRQDLIATPCFNIAAAGAVLRTYLDEERGNLVVAIGDYHSHTAELNRKYQVQVIDKAQELFEAGK